MKTLIIRNDISEAGTRLLLEYLFRISTHFAVIVRPELTLSPEALRFLNDLEPFQISLDIVKEWPGTILFDQEAKLIKYGLNSDSKRILLNKNVTLFDWVQPQLPEDLSFYLEDGQICLTNIAHEKDAWLNLKDSDYEEASKQLSSVTNINN